MNKDEIFTAPPELQSAAPVNAGLLAALPTGQKSIYRVKSMFANANANAELISIMQIPFKRSKTYGQNSTPFIEVAG